MIEDVDLLRCYVNDRSEEAFAEWVQRRIGLVYAVAAAPPWLRDAWDPALSRWQAVKPA